MAVTLPLPRSASNTCRPSSSTMRLAPPGAFVLVLLPMQQRPPRSDAALFIFCGIGAKDTGERARSILRRVTMGGGGRCHQMLGKEFLIAVEAQLDRARALAKKVGLAFKVL